MVPAENASGTAAWPDLLAELTAEVRRVARRLSGLSEPRLRRALAPYGTVADAGGRLASALADAAAGVEERESGTPPRLRPVPELAVTAVGDQVAVTGHDLVTALDAAGPDASVWAGTARTRADAVAADLLALAHEIKLAID